MTTFTPGTPVAAVHLAQNAPTIRVTDLAAGLLRTPDVLLPLCPPSVTPLTFLTADQAARLQYAVHHALVTGQTPGAVMGKLRLSEPLPPYASWTFPGDLLAMERAAARRIKGGALTPLVLLPREVGCPTRRAVQAARWLLAVSGARAALGFHADKAEPEAHFTPWQVEMIRWGVLRAWQDGLGWRAAFTLPLRSRGS